MVMDSLHEWKSTYLKDVGVSGGLKGDFIGAISACWFNTFPPSLPLIIECLTIGLGATDATYHVMWVIVFDAVDDYGIREVNDIARNHGTDHGQLQLPSYMDEVKARVFDEALRGASRIAGLVRLSRLAPPLVFIFQNPSSRLAFWNRTNIWLVFTLD